MLKWPAQKIFLLGATGHAVCEAAAGSPPTRAIGSSRGGEKRLFFARAYEILQAYGIRYKYHEVSIGNARCDNSSCWNDLKRKNIEILD